MVEHAGWGSDLPGNKCASCAAGPQEMESLRDTPSREAAERLPPSLARPQIPSEPRWSEQGHNSQGPVGPIAGPCRYLHCDPRNQPPTRSSLGPETALAETDGDPPFGSSGLWLSTHPTQIPFNFPGTRPALVFASPTPHCQKSQPRPPKHHETDLKIKSEGTLFVFWFLSLSLTLGSRFPLFSANTRARN